MPVTAQEIEAVYPLVRAMVWNKFHRVPKHRLELEDMVQTAMTAVCYKAQIFDPERMDWTKYALGAAANGVRDELRRWKNGTRNGVDHPVDSLNETVRNDDGLSEMEKIDTLPDKEIEFDNVLMPDDVEAALDSLTARQRFTVVQLVQEEVKLNVVGECLGVSDSRVSQIKSEALVRLRSHPKIQPYAYAA